jgi:tellurite resistance protein TehA-like permease
MKQLDGPGMREGLRIAARGTTPAAFAAVMATAIVSTAAERYHMHLLSVVLVALAAVILALLAVLTAARFAYFPTDVATDWRRPKSAFGFLTFVAGVTVLGERLDELGLAAPALFLVGAGILSWVILSYGVQLRIMLATQKPPVPEAVDGSWLLWVVATQSLATAAAMIGVHERALVQVATVVAVCAWAAGTVLYIVIVTIVMARLLLYSVRARDLEPSYWISMGATAITVLAGARILNLPHTIPIVNAVAPNVLGFSFTVWAFGTWMVPFLGAIAIWRHLPPERVPFHYEGGLWSMVFPLGMYAAASAEFGGVARLPFMVLVGGVAAYVAIAAWAGVAAMWLWFTLQPWLRRGAIEAAPQ